MEFNNKKLKIGILLFILTLVLGISKPIYAQSSLEVKQDSIVIISGDTTKLEEIYEIVDEMPTFPGGEKRLFDHLGKTTRYPAKEKKENISGTVYLTFIVDKEGFIKNIEVLREVPNGPGLTTEAIRVIKSMPRWNPGKHKGKKVNVLFNMPFRFSLK